MESTKQKLKDQIDQLEKEAIKFVTNTGYPSNPSSLVCERSRGVIMRCGIFKRYEHSDGAMLVKQELLSDPDRFFKLFTDFLLLNKNMIF
jgi:hypothetical protein